METAKTKTTLRKRLKRSIKSLQSKRDDLIGKRRKVGKKFKAISAKKGKKKMARDLKDDLKKILKKEEKLRSNLKVQKTKLGELKEFKSNGQKKGKKSNSESKKSAKKDKKGKRNSDKKKKSTIAKKDNSEGKKTEKVETTPLQELSPTENSMSYNAKDAIALIRKMSDIQSLSGFVSNESRVTVRAAAKSRRNAILRLDAET